MPSPPVIVTTDLDGPPPAPATASPSTPSRHRRQQSEVSDPGHLSPAHATGGQFTASPAPSASTVLTPPSPTLTTTSSVHFNEELPTPNSEVGATVARVAGDGELLTPIGENDSKDPSTPNHKKNWSVGTWSSGPGGDLTPSVTNDTKVDKKDKKEKKEKKNEPPEYAHLDPSKDTTDPTPFREKPSTLATLVDPKSLDELEKIGGVSGLLEGLGVDPSKGLNTGPVSGHPEHDGGAPRSSGELPAGGGAQYRASLDDRRKVYGRNDLPERKSKSFLRLMWEAFQDKILILLTIVAIISLALGLYQDLRKDGHERFHDEGCPPEGCEMPKVDWVEGVAICVAIIIVVLVGSVNDWQKERQFKKLNAKRDDRTVKVIRGGNEMVINVQELVVGDIAIVEPGEVVPVDGVFVRGHGVRCDESAATGESDTIKKSTYDECIAERAKLGEGQHLKTDCFMLSGSKVLDGVGEYVVIAVGTTSFNGRIMMAMRTDTESTPLQLKLNHLAGLIAWFGGISGILLFVALMIRFFVQLKSLKNPYNDSIPASPNDKANVFINILVISFTLVVVAVPEGLPLAVTLALAFATKRMTQQNLLVRVLGACETMGHATVVCTDKTGTLTQNVMSIVAGSLGVHGKFVANMKDNIERSIADNEDHDSADFSFDMSEMNEVASPELKTLFNEAICVNSTAFEDKIDGEEQFVGSKTETALLRFAKELGWENYKKVRESATLVQMIPFSSELKAMGVVVKTTAGKYRLYIKGASEVLAKKCTRYVVVNPTTVPGVETAAFDDAATNNISKTIIFYADQTLRTLALGYREFESWPPKGTPADTADDQVPFNILARDLTLIAIVGIEDPLRPGVTQAVAECQHAGVGVKMVTGDNVLTARSIARQCGIFTPGGIVMEGPVFRKLSDADRLEISPRLQILARSSPEDKKLLVRTLKSMGEVVGVTGDGTNDGPALKLANVGFAMGIAGTEVAKEASDIILMDDSFSNIVVAVMWGRCVNDAVKKFLQFQLSVNVTAVLITFISAVSSEKESSVLTAVQLLWVNLIMDTFAALALATDPATRKSLDRPPEKKNAPLINVDMIKMIIIQAIYQVILCLVLHFRGHQILNLNHTPRNDARLRALVFNCFVFCQIFNMINCRRLDRKFNIFEGMFKNIWFMSILAIMIGGQILIMFVGGAAFQVTRITPAHWGISIISGFMSIPIGAIVRILPTRPFEKLLIAMKVYPDPSKIALIDPEDVDDDESDDGYTYNPTLEKVRDNLATYARFRGGRIRAAAVAKGSSYKAMKKEGVHLQNLMAMIPALVGGAIGAGGTWVAQANPGGLANPAAQEPSRSTAELFAGRVQLHPDTDPSDPLYAKFGLEPPSPSGYTAPKTPLASVSPSPV
ncbi:plasma membrane calcium [Vanrija albida]|uniref:Calcium-transporting ATPase n=1 Tax=Vanrija albida TaxID=181172 RepID=A0ABR3PSY3_9TREE